MPYIREMGEEVIQTVAGGSVNDDETRNIHNEKNPSAPRTYVGLG